MKKTIATLTVFGALALAPSAQALFGDNYDLLPINGGPGSGTLDVPAMPGEDGFFFAGTCDRGLAPPAGTDLAPLGGIGTMPSTATSPDTVGRGKLRRDRRGAAARRRRQLHRLAPGPKRRPKPRSTPPTPGPRRPTGACRR